MNITSIRQQERKQRIGLMQQSIKEAENPDLKKLVLSVCSEWAISVRTAKEYLKIALFNIENEKGL